MFEVSKQKNPETVSKVNSAEDKICENDRETAQFLSNQFRKVYADHGYTDLVNLVSSPLEELNASELFAEHVVHKKLCMLNDSTSPGPDNIQGAPIKNNPIEKFYISGIVADFFTRFMLFTEEDLGHVSSKLHLNIWFDSKIITI